MYFCHSLYIYIWYFARGVYLDKIELIIFIFSDHKASIFIYVFPIAKPLDQIG